MSDSMTTKFYVQLNGSIVIRGAHVKCSDSCSRMSYETDHKTAIPEDQREIIEQGIEAGRTEVRIADKVYTILYEK